jgi:hypothetical protein
MDKRFAYQQRAFYLFINYFMKNVLLFFIIIIFLNSCNFNKVSEIKENVNYYKLNKIRRVEQYNYSFKFGEIDSTTKELYSVNEYDTLGNEIKSIYYFKDYSTTVDTSDGKQIDSLVTVQAYDKKGNKIAIISYDKDGNLNYKSNITYNELNKIIDIIQYDSYGNVENKVHNIYDKKGDLISSTSNDLKNKNIKITKIKMNGDIAKEILETDENSKILEKYILINYNDSTSIYEKYDSTLKPVIRTENKLYKKNIVASKEIDLKSNTINYEYRIKLNELNLPIEQIAYYNGEPSILYKYVYYKF